MFFSGQASRCLYCSTCGEQFDKNKAETNITLSNRKILDLIGIVYRKGKASKTGSDCGLDGTLVPYHRTVAIAKNYGLDSVPVAVLIAFRYNSSATLDMILGFVGHVLKSTETLLCIYLWLCLSLVHSEYR